MGAKRRVRESNIGADSLAAATTWRTKPAMDSAFATRE